MRKIILTLALLGLGAVSALAVPFPHADHIFKHVDGGDCFACHKGDDVSIVPDLARCKDCHDQKMLDTVTYAGTKTHGPLWGLNHRQEARRNYQDCLKCHDESNDKQVGCAECHSAGFNADATPMSSEMANVHRSEFRVSHPIAARSNPQLCSKCHEPSYCNSCHDRYQPEDLAIKSHRRGWRDLKVSGASHENFEREECKTCHTDSVLPSHDWSGQHAREARRNLSTCQSCHPTGEICITCHSARTGLGINPHPSDWDSEVSKRMEKASGGRTCRKCH